MLTVLADKATEDASKSSLYTLLLCDVHFTWNDLHVWIIILSSLDFFPLNSLLLLKVKHLCFGFEVTKIILIYIF